MKALCIFLSLSSLVFNIFGQTEPPRDSLTSWPREVIPPDTLNGNLFVPSELEYIPADETPELLIDRLSCLQQTITLDYNEKVHAFINYFTIRNRDYTRMVQRRKHQFFPLFEKNLAKYNLPDELKYLSIIESGLNPRAISRARAVGLWQFMSATGKYFGLKHDWYVDERMDPEKSTDAACRYMLQLYKIFGDWHLALAAYNSGPGTVRSAIRRSGYKKTFWEIYHYLPRETRSYVPQFIAIIYTLNYADSHNLVELTAEKLPDHDTLQVRQYLHLKTLAELTGTCLEDIQKLNPSVQKGALPDNGKTHILKIPVTAKANLQVNRLSILDSASKVGKKDLELLARKTTGSTYGRELIVYQVRSGDVLGVIAQRHSVRTEDIKAWNNLKGNLIHPGQKINLWVLPSGNSKSSESASAIISVGGTKTYTVQPGDTLWDISKKVPGLTIEKIKQLNNLKTNKLKPGQKLILG